MILAVLTLINLRGVRESGFLFMAPTYLFVICLLAVLAIGTFKALVSGGHPHPVVAQLPGTMFRFIPVTQING
jgi:amino acid transporter